MGDTESYQQLSDVSRIYSIATLPASLGLQDESSGSERACFQSVSHLVARVWAHFGLDDFYDWLPTAQEDVSVGSSMEVTEFDIWMMRDW